MRRTVLITRPESQSDKLKGLILKQNYDVVSAPFLKIMIHDSDLSNIEKYEALIFTSANGVRAFCNNADSRHFKIFTVGEQTKIAAQESGFQDIENANGNLDDLITLISSKTQTRPYLYIRGGHVSRSLIEVCKNIKIDEKILYSTEKIDKIQNDVLSLLKSEGLSHILFFSSRTAESFVEYMKSSGMEGALKRTKALCLGASMVECLSVLPWLVIKVAAHPNRDGMLALLDD